MGSVSRFSRISIFWIAIPCKAVDAIGGVATKGADSGKLTDYEIGYAPSSRATCRRADCKIGKIEKGELRISIKLVDEDKAHLGGLADSNENSTTKKYFIVGKKIV